MQLNNFFYENVCFFSALLCDAPFSILKIGNRIWKWSSESFEFIDSDIFLQFDIKGATEDLIIVEDLSADVRFGENQQLVEKSKIRFLARASNGLGNPENKVEIYVADIQPRSLPKEKQSALILLACQVSRFFHLEEENFRLNEKTESIISVLESARGSIWSWDVETDLITCSEKWKSEIDLKEPSGELDFQRWTSLIHSDDLGTVLNSIQSCLSNQKPTFEYEYRLRTRSGEYRWLLVKGDCTRNVAGALIRMSGWLEDITNEKKQENINRDQQNRLVQAERLMSLGTMTNGIVHEINNPITVINGCAGHIRTLAESDQIDPKVLLNAADRIEATVQRILAVIKGLRMFSKDGENEPLATVSMKSLIEDTLNFCQSRFKHEGVKLIATPIEPSWLVECHPIAISQVLINLLNNSLDAIDSLPDKWVSITVSQSQGGYVVDVIDSGNGIPKEVQEKLMQPYFTTKKLKGTGLGLSISKAIIERHLGRFYLDSNSKNTRFIIELPKFQKTKRSPGIRLSKEPKVVLVVEDETALTDIIVERFQQKGISYLCANGGRSALELLEKSRVDLILSDIRMAEGNGIEFFEVVQDRFGATIPFIFMTGFAADLLTGEDTRSGVRTVIAKPFKLEDLVATVEQNLI